MHWKNARTRLTETLQYIAGLTAPGVIGLADIARIHGFASNFVNTAFPVGHNDPNATVKAFSERMGLGTTYIGGESAPDRKRLRAIFLLKAAILNAGGITNYSNIPLPRTYINPAGLLLDTLWKARLCWGQANGSTQPHQDLLQYIRNNAVAFLSTNRLAINGSTAQTLDAFGNPTDQNVLNFVFRFNPAHDRYEFWPPGTVLAGAYTVPVVSVKAVHWSLVPGRGNVPVPVAAPLMGAAAPTFANIHGTELGGASIMLTTQFTGCSLCIKTNGGNVYAAHVAPGGPTTPPQIGGGTVLAQQLTGLNAYVGAADFANVGGGAAMNIYGRGHGNLAGSPAGGYPVGEMYVLGFDNGTGVNGWDLFAQYCNNGAINGAARKIW